jgi:hypothetical protein
LTNTAPYLLRYSGNEKDEAFILGVLCSIPFDWYARLFVELHVSFHVMRGLPLPLIDRSDERRQRIIEVAGRLAAPDDRYSEWASEVGIGIGTVTNEVEREDLVAELDALVAHIYGLTREHLQHIFSSFHRGWAYQPRLTAALEFFDRLGEAV